MDSEKDKIIEYLELKSEYHKKHSELLINSDDDKLTARNARDLMLSQIYAVIVAEIKTDMYKAQYKIDAMKRFIDEIQ